MIVALLELCGFEPEEIKAEAPRVEEALARLGLKEQDIALGKERIAQLFEVELRGVRKILGTCLLELVDLVLAKGQGKKFLYSTLPSGFPTTAISAAMLHSDDVHPGEPTCLFALIQGAIFYKSDPVLHAAERVWLDPGNAHCSYDKTLLGLIALDLVPKPDLWICTAYMCNELCKLQELLSETFGVPVHFINRCQDRDWQEPAALPREIEYLARELEKCSQRVGQVVGFELTSEMLDQAEQFRAPYSIPLGKVAKLMVESDPPPISSTITPFLYYLNSLPITRKARAASVAAIEILYDEAQSRAKRGVGAVPKGAPRVLYPAHAFTDLDIVHLLEEHNVAVPLFESALFLPGGCLKPDTRGYQGLFERPACVQSQRSTFNNLQGRVDCIVGACKQFHLDGVFWCTHASCRSSGFDPWLLKEAVRDQLDVPFLVVEGDMWDPKFYTIEDMRAQVRAFAEMLAAHKAASACLTPPAL